MENKSKKNISSEQLAAFLDGNTTAQECQDIIEALTQDEELREVLSISQSVDAVWRNQSEACVTLPMVAMAASCGEENYCCLECEKYILRKLLIEFDEQQLMIDAISRGWLKTEGTALHNVGRHMERKGLIVKRQYNCTLDDLHNYLKEKKYVIAAVDGGELLGNRKEELIEDTIIGQIPDHTVVVLAYDAETKIITIFDPNSDKVEDCYPLEQFMNAWADSKNYLAIVSSQDMETYVPYVIDLSDVVLSDELIELREAIAEHAHNVWAAERQAQGWTYGPQRDDEKKANSLHGSIFQIAR